jgi:hypothetical protein
LWLFPRAIGFLAPLQQERSQQDDVDSQDGEKGDADMGLAPIVGQHSLGNERIWCIHVRRGAAAPLFLRSG